MTISKSQQKAISHGEGPAMILAGPGSGKTLVITKRIQYLIDNKQVKPETILVITFTGAAALEMRERFFHMYKRKVPVVFGTFHAIFFQILKQAYHYSAKDILQDGLRFQILGDLADRHRLEHDDPRELISDLSAEISKVKNDQIPIEHFYSAVCGADTFRKIYQEYHDQLQRRGLIDFDDMLVYTRELFLQRPDILAAWQNRFRYILVDEFQDINAIQYEIVKMLARPENNLFAVGDDDQSIYRFRGAKPEIMLGFTRDFPDAQIIGLKENYRSTPAIVQAAEAVIEENKKRYRKDINCMQPAGPKVELRRMIRSETQALYLIKQIRRARENGREWNQIAILTRTTAGSRYIAEKLMEFSIPFVSTGSIVNIYEHWMAEEIFAYLRLGQGGTDRRDFLRIMNHPTRYISRDVVDTPQIDFDRIGMYYEEKPWMIKRLEKLQEDLQMLGRMRPYAAVNYIRKGMDYDSYLIEYAQKRHIPKEDLIEIADDLQERAGSFESFAQWMQHVEEYTQMLEEQRKKERDNRTEDALILQTMHASKGLEYEEVFIPDINEGNIPHKKAVLDADIEEERRILYVGMTRAKQMLHLFYVKEQYGREAEPSRFLEVFDLEE